MNKQKITALAIALLVIGAAAAFSACASMASTEPKSGLESQVQTAAAATLVQYMIETEVAANLPEPVSEPVAQATQPQPTATLLPTQPPSPTSTPTPLPTLPPTTPPTVPPPQAPAASGTKIVADQNTNCRVGPSTYYTIESVFMKGDESTVTGIDKNKNWWYIVDPQNSGNSCWVWEGSTTVVGDTSTLPVVDAPSTGYATTTNPYYKYGYNYNTCYPYAGCNPANVHNYYGCVNYSHAFWQNCNQNQWWVCNQNVTCVCKPKVNCWNWNPCKKSSCPPLTQVNFKKYCKNYPQCCDSTKAN